MNQDQVDWLDVVYPVNEMFETVQGEAHWTGTPAVFIRLQGCPVGCGWCDTKHTWPIAEPGDATSMPAMIAKRFDSASYARITIADIIGWLNNNSTAMHVVITGGEPCIHDLFPLTRRIAGTGRTVQIETSGTHEIKCDPRTWVTVSPKIDMPGGLKVRPDAIARANEIKHPVGKMRDINNLLTVLPDKHADALVWLQPLSQSAKATTLCVNEATTRGWRVSIQVHKYMGVR